MTANWITIWGFGQYSVVKGRGDATREVRWHATLMYLVLGALSLGTVALLGGRLMPLFDAPTAAKYVPGMALALFIRLDYAAAGVPMLPVVAGERTTRHQIGLYTIPMAAAAIAPWPLGLTGATYGIAAVVLNLIFIGMAAPVALRTAGEGDTMRPEKRLFRFSLFYLALIFTAVVADRWMA